MSMSTGNALRELRTAVGLTVEEAAGFLQKDTRRVRADADFEVSVVRTLEAGLSHDASDLEWYVRALGLAALEDREAHASDRVVRARGRR